MSPPDPFPLLQRLVETPASPEVHEPVVESQELRCVSCQAIVDAIAEYHRDEPLALRRRALRFMGGGPFTPCADGERCAWHAVLFAPKPGASVEPAPVTSVQLELD